MADQLDCEALEKRIDSLVGTNKKSIVRVLKLLNREKDVLQRKVDGASDDDVSDAQKEVTEVVERLDQMSRQCDAILSEGRPRRDTLITAEMEHFADKTFKPVNDLALLFSVQKYLQKVLEIKKIDEQLTKCTGVTFDMEVALSAYMKLVLLCDTGLVLESWEHLKGYCMQLKNDWCQKLKINLSRVLQKDLKTSGWPFISGSGVNIIKWKSVSEHFSRVMLHMFAIEKCAESAKLPKLSDPLHSVISAMIEPLRKRFVYHFHEDRKTNDTDKPEWFLSQVLLWIKDHGPFIKDHVQPLLSGTEFERVNVRVEFIRGLLQITHTKLREALLVKEKLVHNDDVVAHWIDEILEFERDLRPLEYPSPLPSCVTTLLEATVFNKWTIIEKKLAVERMAVVTSSATAWETVQGTTEDGTTLSDAENRLPECAEKLMSIISSITDRYSLLPSLPHQLDFLNIQVFLLNEFHVDLLSAVQGHDSLLSKQLLAYLNTAHFIAAVLRQWGEQTFFLKLAYCHQLFTGSPPDPSKADTSISLMDYDEDEFEQVLSKDPALYNLSCTAFEVPTESFEKLVQYIVDIIVEKVLTVFKSSCETKWAKEKWHSLPPPNKSYLVQEISESGLQVCMTVRDQFQFLSSKLHCEVKHLVLDKVIAQMDIIILKQVVMVNYFSDGGAAQFCTDLMKNLLPLLTQHLNLPKEHILPKSTNACTLLGLLPGSVKLLAGVLVKLQFNVVSEYDTAVAALRDIKVSHLEPREAELILARRIIS